jgi:2-oxoglutarate dehydrogenase complex dehydrogenase (E1) component-like enzyme
VVVVVVLLLLLPQRNETHQINHSHSFVERFVKLCAQSRHT